MSTWTDKDSRDFELYCTRATDAQLQGIHDKEQEARKRNRVGASQCVRISARDKEDAMRHITTAAFLLGLWPYVALALLASGTAHMIRSTSIYQGLRT